LEKVENERLEIKSGGFEGRARLPYAKGKNDTHHTLDCATSQQREAAGSSRQRTKSRLN